MSSKHTVMVIEDNDFVRMQTAGFLKEAGYVVTEAIDGLDAEGKIDPLPSAMVVDVRMEPKGGFDFVRSIRSQGIDTPVILMTGDQNSDLLAQAGKLGVSTVLLKPLQKERLLSMIERIITRQKDSEQE